MTDLAIQNSFRRAQAIKSHYSGHVDYGYTHGLREKIRRTNIETCEFLNVFRQKRATEWRPLHLEGNPLPMQISCYAIYHNHVCLIPNYAGHLPGAKFRFGRTFGHDTLDAKRWLRGDFRPN